jgi:hypothetical protein
MLKDWFKVNSHRLLKEARIAILVSGFLLAAAPEPASAQDSRASATFSVTVNLVGQNGALPLPGGNGAFCINRDKPDAFGARVIVICKTGEIVQLAGSDPENLWLPIHGGANRYIANLTNSGSYRGTVNGYMSAGTVASWRQVSFTNRDYLELLVAW